LHQYQITVEQPLVEKIIMFEEQEEIGGYEYLYDGALKEVPYEDFGDLDNWQWEFVTFATRGERKKTVRTPRKRTKV
jgi:hypothetical protein